MKILDKNIAIVFMAALLIWNLLRVTGKAQVIDNFDYYQPFDTLNVTLNSYGNTRQYPYMTILMGATAPGLTSQFTPSYLVIHSKTSSITTYKDDEGKDTGIPVFGFEYYSGFRNSNPSARYGNIRMYYRVSELQKMIADGDIYFTFTTGTKLPYVTDTGNSSTMVEMAGNPTPNFLTLNQGNYASIITNGVYNSYMEFDFYWDCASDLTSKSDLRIPGLNGITDSGGTKIPYKYIITSRGEPGGGGSAQNPPSNGTGAGGRPGNNWGGNNNGNNGNGGDGPPGSGEIKVPIRKPPPLKPIDSRDYDDKDIVKNPPEYWKKPPPNGSVPDLDLDIPPDDSGYIIGEGSTGETGGTWDLPEYEPPPITLFPPNIPKFPYDGPGIPITIPPDYRFDNGWPPSFVWGE